MLDQYARRQPHHPIISRQAPQSRYLIGERSTQAAPVNMEMEMEACGNSPTMPVPPTRIVAPPSAVRAAVVPAAPPAATAAAAVAAEAVVASAAASPPATTPEATAEDANAPPSAPPGAVPTPSKSTSFSGKCPAVLYFSQCWLHKMCGPPNNRSAKHMAAVGASDVQLSFFAVRIASPCFCTNKSRFQVTGQAHNVAGCPRRPHQLKQQLSHSPTRPTHGNPSRTSGPKASARTSDSRGSTLASY